MCVPPAASCVVLFHVFDEVDLLGVSRSGRTTREVSRPTERERARERDLNHDVRRQIFYLA